MESMASASIFQPLRLKYLRLNAFEETWSNSAQIREKMMYVGSGNWNPENNLGLHEVTLDFVHEVKAGRHLHSPARLIGSVAGVVVIAILAMVYIGSHTEARGGRWEKENDIDGSEPSLKSGGSQGWR